MKLFVTALLATAISATSLNDHRSSYSSKQTTTTRDRFDQLLSTNSYLKPSASSSRSYKRSSSSKPVSRSYRKSSRRSKPVSRSYRKSEERVYSKPARSSYKSTRYNRKYKRHHDSHSSSSTSSSEES